MVLIQFFQQSQQLAAAEQVVLTQTDHQADQAVVVVSGMMETLQAVLELLIKVTRVVMVSSQALIAVWVAVAVALVQLAQMVTMVKVAQAVQVLQYR
jgi:hypothetical protein